MSEYFILVGFLLFVVVILPILLDRDYRQRRKVKRIIESYRTGKNKSDSEGEAGKSFSNRNFLNCRKNQKHEDYITI